MARKKKSAVDGAAILALVEKILSDDQAISPLVIDMRGKSSIADTMVIASGRSGRHVGAMAQHLTQQLKELGAGPIRAEGVAQGDWVLVDAGDVLVHLVRPEVRAFYNLEKMWGLELPDSPGDTEPLAGLSAS